MITVPSKAHYFMLDREEGDSDLIVVLGIRIMPDVSTFLAALCRWFHPCEWCALRMDGCAVHAV